MKTLPEKYCIKVNGAGREHPFIKYLSSKYKTNIEGCDMYYVNCGNSWNSNHFNNIWDYPEITLDQFLEATQNNMENRKIIGYKAPYDMFGGVIKKGCFYEKLNQYYNPITYNTTNYSLPAEIVEKWPPVYEEEKIMLDGSKYEIEIKSFKEPSIDGHYFSKKFWEAAKIVSEHSKASVVLGCGAKHFNMSNKVDCWKISVETINKVLDKLK